MKLKILLATVAALACTSAQAQVNSGSNGSDGALDFSGLASLGYSTNIVINMSDHPNGIYQYTSVNIPTNVTVTFIPNANNSPVTWLVQGSCIISGTVDVSGQRNNGTMGGEGGPGGSAGGMGAQIQGNSVIAFRGSGLGGGDPAQYIVNVGGNTVGGGGSYATGGGTAGAAAGLTYGNKYLLPLLGGSGGGGGLRSGVTGDVGGGGGGGAILVVSDSSILVNGSVTANGGYGGGNYVGSGGGSGGGVRLVSPQISGTGILSASGGSGNWYRDWNSSASAGGGSGFVRLDTLADQFTGTLNDSASRGFNPILVAPTQTASLAIQSIAGNAVPANPTGVLFTPDATISSQQTNPIPVVVRCANLPLGTPITVVVKPANGAMILGSTANNTGTQASSTATVSIVMPRGGGLVYATAATSH